ncbi:NOP protein chaperone 1-like [Oratosquilla oratoria]|uniref:NOP protein chaperone 1-like n=1 Tax=Oratosquilla oratoria TaxID=337810 RepID=UPI003F75E4B5
MANSNNASKPTTSKELLQITGDGSQTAVVESLFRKQPGPFQENKPKTFKVARSPLFDQLQTFLPKLETANQRIPKDTEEVKELDIENTDGCEKVIEMNLLMGMAAPSDSESEESDSDTESDSDSSSDMYTNVTEKTLKLPSDIVSRKRRGENLIENLSSEDREMSESECTEVSSGSGER